MANTIAANLRNGANATETFKALGGKVKDDSIEPGKLCGETLGPAAGDLSFGYCPERLSGYASKLSAVCDDIGRHSGWSPGNALNRLQGKTGCAIERQSWSGNGSDRSNWRGSVSGVSDCVCCG